ncbi:MAG: leucine-rich repeat domain-containing protein, partial [Clostridia bacterium]|nr:leucine-rich repeat domain-containing protein [Clostridia bacterium]
MKKRYVILVLCICAVFAVIFGACNNTQNNSNSNKDYGTIEKIEVIIKGNNDSPNYYSCVYDDIPNNHEAFTLEDVTVNYVYTNGYRKKIGEDYYEVIKYNPDGQLSFNKVLFDFMENGETSANVPGTYKLLFKTTDGLHSVDVVIDIIKSGVKEHEFNLKRYTDLEESDSEKVDVTAMTSINFAQQYNAEYKNYFFEACNYSINENGISFVVTPYSENIVINPITVTYKGKEYPKDQYFDQIQVGKVVNGNELLTMDDKLLPPGKYFVFAKFGETNPRFSVYSHPIPIEITTGALIITKGKTIAEKQFLGDKTITEVIIGDSITSIGSGAFEDCTSLTRVTIPDSINSMENGVFKGCTSLTDITFPDSLKSIGNGVFEGCTSLTSITIPDTVTSIECGAFGGCSSLEEITIPFVGNNASAVGAIGLFGYIFGTSAFSGGKMTKQYYNYYSETHATYCIPTSLKKVTVNGDMIPFGSFYACDSLTSITVGNSIESIGDWAFYGCRNLVSVTIGSSVTSVSYEAVSGSYNLVEIYNLSSLNITAGSSSNGYLGRYALDVYTSLDSPSKLSTDSNGYIIYTDGDEKILIGYTGSETELKLPSSITAINKYAFYKNSSITSVVIPDSVTSIGDHAFDNCYRL